LAVTEFFAGIPVADFRSMLAWYERLFGKPPAFFPHDREAVWQITDHAWIYVVEDVERAGKALITILVDDIDTQVVELAERDVPVGPIETMDVGVRHVAIHDPEGNRVTFGQPPDA
jgi:catechol 2,3-dioxygenase-like lactoylglutathione lyase family enzyme